MVSCRHRWQLRDVQTPFRALCACDLCRVAIRASLHSGVTESKMRLEVLSYGQGGVGLEDMESLLVWLWHQLQLGRLKEPAVVSTSRSVRHKKKKKAA